MTTATKFADLGTIVRVLSFDDEQIKDKLKPAVYTVSFDPMSGFFLSKHSDRLSTPSRVYGTIDRKVNKIVSTYDRSERSMGILLSGEKGSGKTMTSSIAANRCLDERNIPIILVEQSFGQGLVDFINQIGECVLFIDEFGKKFDNKEGEQNSLLGLFDGTNSGKRLVILTENKVRTINTYILDRPGRVHYHFRHEKLDTDIITEYCEDKEIPKNVTADIVFRRDISMEFSFDVLQAIVKEYLQFGGEIEDICEDLNIEQPINLACDMMEITEIYDDTNGKQREIVKNRRGYEFPTGHNHVIVTYKGLDGRDDYNDYATPSVKDIVEKNDESFVFKTYDDCDNLITIKATRIPLFPNKAI